MYPWIRWLKFQVWRPGSHTELSLPLWKQTNGLKVLCISHKSHHSSCWLASSQYLLLELVLGGGRETWSDASEAGDRRRCGSAKFCWVRPVNILEGPKLARCGTQKTHSLKLLCCKSYKKWNDPFSPTPFPSENIYSILLRGQTNLLLIITIPQTQKSRKKSGISLFFF